MPSSALATARAPTATGEPAVSSPSSPKATALTTVAWTTASPAKATA
jgi:hypothetical protein